jgi:hypothetical protein
MITLQMKPAEVKRQTVYVMPAFNLSPVPTHSEDTGSLRADASHNGSCYVQITRALGDGTYLAKVAAHVERVAQGYTIVVSDEQLAQGYPHSA